MKVMEKNNIKKKIFMHISSNAVISNFNNNSCITKNSNISKTENKNIVFNNFGSMWSINNNKFKNNRYF